MTVKEAIDIGMIAFGALQTLALFLTFGIMRRTAIRQLRAYVAVDSAKFIRNPKNDNAPWSIDVAFKNFGLTPAHKLGVKVEVEIGQPKAADIIIPLSTKAAPRSQADLPPQHSRTVRIECPELPYGDDGFISARFAGNKAYVWGRADYADAFKKQRFVSFQMVCHFEEVADFAVCDNGNDSD
jgi:hypothetical protein